MLQELNRRIIRFRRQYAANSVVRIGKRLRELESDSSSSYSEIEQLERQRGRLLDYIRRTA